jgi:hypothetical protein
VAIPKILFEKSPTKGSNALFENPLFSVVSGIINTGSPAGI